MTSGDPSSSSEALEKADKYLQQSSTNVVKETTSTQDRMVVNKTTVEERGVSANQDAFLQTLEQDAKERAARRKEREARGKQAKREGSKKFRNGDFEGALVHFTEAIRETPWDITLYTNRALVRETLMKLPTPDLNTVSCRPTTDYLDTLRPLKTATKPSRCTKP